VNLAEEWDKPDFTMEQKQAAIAETLTAVIIKPAGRGVRFRPDHIVPGIPRERHGRITGLKERSPGGMIPAGATFLVYPAFSFSSSSPMSRQ
jgi:hypothetical protein